METALNFSMSRSAMHGSASVYYGSASSFALCLVAVVLVAGHCSFSSKCSAQDSSQTPIPDEQSTSPHQEKEKDNTPRVVGLHVRGTSGEQLSEERRARGEMQVILGDDLIVDVSNLEILLDQQKKAPRQPPIVPFLNDLSLKEVAAFAVREGDETHAGQLFFHLERTDGTDASWSEILGRPTFAPRKFTVSVGILNQNPIEIATDRQIELKILPWGTLLLWTFVFAALAIGFVLLALFSDLLKVPGGVPTGPRPFSLARTQAAWWFFVVLGSYLFIGIVLGDFTSSINSQVVLLLAISGATALGATTVDMVKDRPTTDVTGVQQPVAPKPLPQSDGFWLDILSDDVGVSVYRFQLVAWTIVLGLVFVFDVYDKLAMPRFDATLLGLMGISSGAYVTLKSGEMPVPSKPKNSKGKDANDGDEAGEHK
jgi:hypothetical protein